MKVGQHTEGMLDALDPTYDLHYILILIDTDADTLRVGMTASNPNPQGVAELLQGISEDMLGNKDNVDIQFVERKKGN